MFQGDKKSSIKSTNLLWLLSLLIAACTITQWHLSTSLLKNDSHEAKAEIETHDTRQRKAIAAASTMMASRVEVKEAVRGRVRTTEASKSHNNHASPSSTSPVSASSDTRNMTHEIFFAPSSIEKYGSPVVPEEERQWLEAKRQQWPPKQIPTLPLPIFVLNLPKSGTQSIFDYFAKCGTGKHWIAHYWIQRFHSKVGRCLADNVWANRPMAQGCGEAKLAGYAIYTDSGLMWSEEEEILNTTTTATLAQPRKKKKSTRKCFFPGVHGLENIATYYPNATILHFPRNSTQWEESSSHWNHLLERYDTFCGGFPEVQQQVSNVTMDIAANGDAPGVYEPKHPATTQSEWATFYEQYTQRIRDFAKQHPSLTYLERPLEDMEGTAKFLEERTGISASCYTRSHINKKRRKQQQPNDDNETVVAETS